LEKTPNILKRVRVRQTANVLALAVIHRDVDRIVVADSDIALMLIRRNDFSFVREFCLDEIPKGFVADMVSGHLKPHLAAALDSAHNANLAVMPRLDFPSRLVRFVHPL